MEWEACLIAETWPGLGGPADVMRLPYHYFRQLRGFLIKRNELQAEAAQRTRDGLDDWDEDVIEGDAT